MSILTSPAEARIVDFVKKSLKAHRVHIHSYLQELWGGQGHIIRLVTDVPAREQVIVKYIAPTNQTTHPRGWNTSKSYERKLRSYAVEGHWYTHHACHCTERCKVPALFAIDQDRDTRLFLLEDLSIQYPQRPASLNVNQVRVCLRWLAAFHAQFLFEPADGLWPRGCYWHLATRDDEWQAMIDGPVKQAASWLDEQLASCCFQTLVHGDAKLANFCFSQDLSQVAAVDFQYVGRGCGMSDVVYLLGSCLSEQDCDRYEQVLLNAYFSELRQSVEQRLQCDSNFQAMIEPDAQSSLCESLETQWRSLYELAWTDFYRFLLGWMPEHSKINRYTEKLAERALKRWRSN